MDDFTEPSQRSPIRLLLTVVLVLIVYGSLYPFEFAGQHTAMFAWVWDPGLAGIRDAMVNLAIYFPVGFLVFCAAGARGGILMAVLVSLAVSGTLECLQSFDRGRVSSSLDLLLNGVSGFLGGYAASLAHRRVTASPGAFAVMLLAIVARTYPFVPSLHPHWSAFRWEEVAYSTVDWLVVGFALRIFLQRDSVRRELALMMLAVPARVFILDQAGSPGEVCGALLAIATGGLRRQILALLMILGVIARELLPMHFSSIAQDFHWIPFETYLLGPSAGVVVLLNKLLLYGSLLWLLDAEGRHVWRNAGGLAGFVGLLEWVQRYLPGRTPDISDSILVLVAGCALWALPGRSPAAGEPARTW